MTAMSRAPSTQRFRPQEYLRLEETADVKHEFHAGEILAMSGGTYNHSRITMNLSGEMYMCLKGSPCAPLESNIRVRLLRSDRYVYPDITVVCGAPEFDPLDTRRTTIVNPKVIVEVLSESTEGYDRGVKFSAYRDLHSLEEYVLVSQSQPMIEAFRRRPDGAWVISSWRGLDAIATIDSLGIQIALADVYAGVTFEDERAFGQS